MLSSNARRNPRAVLVALAACAAAACAARRAPDPESRRPDPVDYLTSRGPAYVRARGALDRVDFGSPYPYFRLTNIPSAQAVCGAFRDVRDEIPVVQLHGDAHLEQYAFIDGAAGLTDFDDAASGPAVLDLVRFAASLRLAEAARRWPPQEPDPVAAFLSGYQAALEDPELRAPQPKVVQRLAARCATNPLTQLEFAETLMQPLAVQPRALQWAVEDLGRRILEQRPNLPSDFFEVKSWGQIHLGLGSLLDEKFLVRVEGETSAPGDDMLFEVKEVSDLAGVECIRQSFEPDGRRILSAYSSLSRKPEVYLGYVKMGARAAARDFPDRRRPPRAFWVHAWPQRYRELSVGDLASREELAEVAYDAGTQLGHGHPAGARAPDEIRARLRRLLERQGPRIRETAERVARATIRGWEQLRLETGQPLVTHADQE